MAIISSQKGPEPKMRKMLVAIPEDVYKALKHQAVEKDAMMKDLVTEALRRYLGMKEGGERGKK
jgi:hypothetical protein